MLHSTARLFNGLFCISEQILSLIKLVSLTAVRNTVVIKMYMFMVHAHLGKTKNTLLSLNFYQKNNLSIRNVPTNDPTDYHK